MEKNREIEGVQYLRGIAALAVVFDHASGMANFPKYFGKEAFDGFLRSGARGVDVFFVISGFIIVISAMNSDFSPKLAVKEFLKRRFQRIVPLMWISIISYALLRIAGRGGWNPVETITAFTLFPAGPVAPDVIWTLRLELIFYVIFAISVLASTRRWWVLAAWVLAPVALTLIGADLAPWGTLGDVLANICHPANVEFGVGVIIGIYYLRNRNFTLQTFGVDPLFLMMALFFVLMVVADHYKFNFSSVYYSSVCAVIGGLIVFVGAFTKQRKGIMDRVFGFMGNASYAIYLFHLHFLSAMLGIWSKLAPHTPILVVLLGCAGGSIAAASVIHKFVEVPLIRAVKNFRWPAKVTSLSN